MAKKPKLTEDIDAAEDLHSDDPDAVIDSQFILSIEKLQEIQDDLEKVNEEESEKVLEVEQKYSEIRMPVYARRNDIIKSIPDFWLTAFMSHPTLAELLSEEDHTIFKHLEALEVEDFKDVKSGYSITMNFSSNPYFKDKKLSKTYSFSDDGTTTVTGTPIEWKADMDVTKGGSEKKGNKRTLARHSFFSWFSETQQKDNSDDFYDEGDSFSVAEIIKEDLWPNPLKYFISDTDVESDEDEDEDDAEEDEDHGDEK